MSRRIARELVLKSLFQMDFGTVEDLEKAYDTSRDEENVSEVAGVYAMQVLDGTVKNLEVIDALLAKYAKEWTVDRMPAVDRNILRMAVYEIFYAEDKIAPSVAINEAVEVAKEYSTEDSARFINGVLGKMVKDHEQA